MIKKVKASLSEKILLIFLISLGIFSFSFFFITKNKCIFVKKIDLEKIQFNNSENIAVMNVECGNVVIELFPDLSPNSVKRFKNLIKKGSYNHSAFYRVLKDTLVQAGDLDYGNIDDINYRLGVLLYKNDYYKDAMEPLRQYIIQEPDSN